MIFPKILDVWRGLALPDSTLAELLADARAAARDDSKTATDCPFHYVTDSFSKACKIAWRVAFRFERERRQLLLFTLPVKLAA